MAFCFSGVLGLLFSAIVVKWSCGVSKKGKGSGKKKNQKKIGKICLHFWARVSEDVQRCIFQLMNRSTWMASIKIMWY